MTDIDKIDKKNNTEEIFLNELVKQFDREIDLVKTLDDKAHKMITISGSIATLNIAIGTFLISRIQLSNFGYLLSGISLFVILVLYVISIYKFKNAYDAKVYKFPFGYERFFNNNGYKYDFVDQMRNLS